MSSGCKAAQSGWGRAVVRNVEWFSRRVLFGIGPLRLPYLAALGTVIALHIVTAEPPNRVFYRRQASTRSRKSPSPVRFWTNGLGAICHHGPMRSHTNRTAVDPQALLDSAGVAGTVVTYRKAASIYSQGDLCKAVMYLQKGEVRLSVRSETGKEAIVAVVGPGDFFGEGALAGQPRRSGSATANTSSTVVVIEKIRMLRVLHEQQAQADRFLAHLLTRNREVEEDLIDQLFDGAEKRLARALLLLARYGEPRRPRRMIPRTSHTALAEMAGITRSRVHFLMNKFRKLGFIETDHALAVNKSLLNVVLHD